MKTYDCFVCCGKDDLLNLRFKILNKDVDYFVICESSKFHSGVEKKKIFNIKKFKEYKKKIRYYYLTDMPLHDGNNWAYENYQRNSLHKGLYDANPEDIVLVSNTFDAPSVVTGKVGCNT